MDDGQPSRKRGAYKRYKLDSSVPIPRQTLHNWRKQVKCSSTVPAPDREVDNPYPDASVTGAREIETGEVSEDDRDDHYIGGDSDGYDGYSSSSEDEGDSQPSPAPTLLYEGAQISEEMGMMLVLSMATKHRLTLSALADILKVMSLHLPSGTPVPPSYKSVYRLLKKVATMGGSLSSATLSHRYIPNHTYSVCIKATGI